MEIKGTQSRPLIFPELHWLIYITEICHWRNIHKLRPNQTGLKDWRAASRECLLDWSVNFFCTKMPCMVWPSLKYVLFWICRIFMQGGSRQRKGCPVGLISRPSDFILNDRWNLPFDSLHLGASKRLLGSSERTLCFSSSVFRAKPQFGSVKFAPPPRSQLAAAVKQMQNEESRLQELFRWVCPGWMFVETYMRRNKEEGRKIEPRYVM